MQKLEKGGWLTHRAEGRSYVYQPTRSRAQAGSSSLRQLIDGVFRGDPLLLFRQLIDEPDLSVEDLDTVRRMIDRRRKERRDD